MGEMIERLAKAAFKATEIGVRDTYNATWQREFERAVRAILTELREPTQEILDKGGKYLFAQSSTNLDMAWQAMIDAVLEESREPPKQERPKPDISNHWATAQDDPGGAD